MTIDRVETSVPDSQGNRNVGVLDCSDTSTRTYTISPINVETSSGYAFSVWLKSSESTDITINVLGSEASTFAVTPSWVRYEKVVSSATSSTIVFTVPDNFVGMLYMYEGMLSKGDAIVDWVMANEDLSNNSDTIINGSNITTGSIKSNLYAYTSGDFSDSGMMIDLDNNVIRSPYFKVDENGASFTGRLETTSGTIAGITIDDYSLTNNYELKINNDVETRAVMKINSGKYDDVGYGSWIQSVIDIFGYDKNNDTDRYNNSIRILPTRIELERPVASNDIPVGLTQITPHHIVVTTGRSKYNGGYYWTPTTSCIFPDHIEEAGESLSDKYTQKFKSGDTLNCHGMWVYGGITAGKSRIYVNIPVANGIRGGVTASATSLKGMIRQNNSYIVGDGTNQGTITVGAVTITTNRQNLTVRLDVTDTSKVPMNNDTCSVYIDTLNIQFT